MTHELKIFPHYYGIILLGLKKFEVRKNDRNYQVGDQLLLKEFVPKGYYEDGLNDDQYTGRILHRRIDYILKGGKLGIEDGYVVMSLSVI